MPTPPRPISFIDRHQSLIDKMLREGRYKSDSDVVREAMEGLENKLEHLDYLRRLGHEGEADLAAGRYTDVPRDQLGAHLSSLGRRARG